MTRGAHDGTQRKGNKLVKDDRNKFIPVARALTIAEYVETHRHQLCFQGAALEESTRTYDLLREAYAEMDQNVQQWLC